MRRRTASPMGVSRSAEAMADGISGDAEAECVDDLREEVEERARAGKELAHESTGSSARAPYLSSRKTASDRRDCVTERSALAWLSRPPAKR